MQYYNGKATYGTANVITVTSGNTQSAIDFALANGGTITGNVSDTTFGAPAAGIDIDIYDANTQVKLAQTAITDAQGNYSLTNLPAGQYILRINPGPGRPYFLEYYSNAATAGAATVVVVPAGGTVPNINFAADLDIANLSAANRLALLLSFSALLGAAALVSTRLRLTRN
jgi:5-hydroxyisourate hydrolase-like protein (transthyretin family)